MCKTRFGFVSNSSSSSFILPLDGDNKNIIISIPTEKFIDMFYADDETSIDCVVRTQDELKAHICNEYNLDMETFYDTLLENDYIEKIYSNSLKMIEEGKIVVFGDVSYHDRGLQIILKNLGAQINT